MARERPIRFEHEPEKMIRETEQMRAVEELAYRRVLDFIVLCRNRLMDDDAELARMTKTGRDWPVIKLRLVEDHGALYVSDDGYIRNVRYDEIWTSVERSIRQKSQAGKASAAKRAKKNAAPPRPPAPMEPTPVETAPQQALPEPPTTGVEAGPPGNAAPELEPMAPAPAPTGENGNGDGDSKPEQEHTRIPAEWRPCPEGVAFALDRGFTQPQIEPLTRGFVAHNTAKGTTSKNWDASWPLWVLRVLRDLDSNGPPEVHQPANA